MNIVFEKLGNKHQKEVMDIFNYYVEKQLCRLRGTPAPGHLLRKNTRENTRLPGIRHQRIRLGSHRRILLPESLSSPADLPTHGENQLFHPSTLHPRRGGQNVPRPAGSRRQETGNPHHPRGHLVQEPAKHLVSREIRFHAMCPTGKSGA